MDFCIDIIRLRATMTMSASKRRIHKFAFFGTKSEMRVERLSKYLLNELSLADVVLTDSVTPSATAVGPATGIGADICILFNFRKQNCGIPNVDDAESAF